jgi:hypothetical protein
MNTKEALEIVGGLSKPSKMPGWSYGLPAKECKTGSKLRKVPGSTCFDCYALKGCYVFKVVQDAQYRRLAAIRHPLWVQAMAQLINSKKPDVFRWHDSGDVQDLEHLNKIYEHWMPTREAWIQKHEHRAPDNLTIRFSMPMVDQAPAGKFKNYSTVISKDHPWFGETSIVCPAPQQDNECKDCRNCWNKEIKNVSYGIH